MKAAIKSADLKDSKQWLIRGDSMVHRTGCFFSIRPVRHKGGCSFPIIDQPEIGTLGILANRRTSDRTDLLLQWKFEPGNVGGWQWAPTCQATYSNIMRAHKGAEPPYSKGFIQWPFVSDSLQSEQGFSFFKKRNRNVVKLIEFKPCGETHAWMPFSSVQRLLLRDFISNTDLRSVIASSDWKLLLGKPRVNTSLKRELWDSFLQEDTTQNGSRLKWKQDRARRRLTPGNWNECRHLVSHWDVTCPEREVPQWDQPLLNQIGVHRFRLYSDKINGIRKFFFAFINEPGLYNKVEFGPVITHAVDRKAKTIARVYQSEEGGRFYQNISEYEIVDSNNPGCDDGCWLTLASIQKLVKLDCTFTSEARTLISMVLAFM